MKINLCFILIMVLCLVPVSIKAKKIRKERAILDYYSIFTSIRGMKLIFEDVIELRDIFFGQSDSMVNSVLFRNKHQDIKDSFLKVTSKLSALERDIGSIADTVIDEILQSFPKKMRLELSLHEIRKIINQINYADEQMHYYLITDKNIDTKDNITDWICNICMKSNSGLHSSNNGNGNLKDEVNYDEKNLNNNTKEMENSWAVEEFTLKNFATWVTGHDYNSLRSLQRRMNDLVAPNDTVGIFNLILETSQQKRIGNSMSACDLKMSVYQTIFNLYNVIIIAELKANSMLQFCYMLLKLFDEGDFKKEHDLAMTSSENSIKNMLKVLQEVLPSADRSFYKCDPIEYKENTSYVKLTRLLQGYIENEATLSPSGSCTKDCKYYSHTKYYSCSKDRFCSKQPPCAGRVLNCTFVKSDMEVCTSSNPEKRYQWVHYQDNVIYGTEDECEQGHFHEVNSWWRYLFFHCSYCLCLCDDETGSDRHFNLREVTSDLNENKVITGVKIVKKNRIIHFQIQQGVLLNRGIIDKTTLSWKPIEEYSVTDPERLNNVDYHTMNWLDRSIDLDDLTAPKEHVLTGIRFRKIGSSLNLEIRVTPVRFTSDKVLQVKGSYWMGNENTPLSENARSEITFSDPNIPLDKGPHFPMSLSNTFIKFQPTTYELDLAQNTVPFFDSQELTSAGYPLSGLGIIYKGAPNSGGFIAPKLISYDFLPHLNVK